MANWLKRLFGPDKLQLALDAKEAALLEKEKRLEAHQKRLESVYSTHKRRPALNLETAHEIAFPIRSAVTLDKAGKAMDSECVGLPNANYRFSTRGGVPDVVVGWFLSQSFIGHQMCAIMAQNWLINRACKIPAEDATRNGWEITGLDPDKEKELADLDAAWNIKQKTQEFARFNRVFGFRIAIYCVDSPDKLYYEKPFNLDSVTPGSYRGISQVDPNWCSAEFDNTDLMDPASQEFYEPTYWRIAGKRYHRSHLEVIRYVEVPDLLKPSYLFGGISLPQLIWERVYCAERSANEGPQLLMTKRMNVIKTDLDDAQSNAEVFADKQREISENRDNYGLLNLGREDSYEQHETSLSDFDVVVMTEYQLCAGIAEMPSTKLIGTSPKGFSPTGAYETGSYRETLASIQEHHCGPFLKHHYMIACKSMGFDDRVEIVWNPLDEPTESETAATNLVKAQTRQIYQDLGVTTQEQTQQVLKDDKNSGYDFEELEDGEENELATAILALKPRSTVQPKPAQANPVDVEVSNEADKVVE